MADITELTAQDFEQVTSGDTPVLVDFWAEWCGPCKAIAPILNEMAAETAGKLRIAKLNVDEHPDIPRKLGIMSIPTLILFSGGEERKRVTGARSKDQLIKEFELA